MEVLIALCQALFAKSTEITINSFVLLAALVPLGIAASVTPIGTAICLDAIFEELERPSRL